MKPGNRLLVFVARTDAGKSGQRNGANSCRRVFLLTDKRIP
jgi:hypothetical protein